MKEGVLKDYTKVDSVSSDKIKQYESKLPEKFINVWKEYGFGTFMEGYFKVVDPDEYMELLKESYFDAEVSIPIMVTAFGDIITWENNKSIGIVQHKIGDCSLIESGFVYFFEDLEDEEFQEEFFELDMYKEAVGKYGPLEFDECYGFVPLLGLGGSEKVENLDKVKTKEHIALITELMGKIE